MKHLPFKKSMEVSIGTELEFQIINPTSFALVSRAKDLIKSIKGFSNQNNIKPEITQSMIEINSTIHHSPQEMIEELLQLKNFLAAIAEELGIAFCGGGTHPFQKWTAQKIYPSKRYKNLASKYRFLSKQSTVFGQHVHVGCTSPEDAIYLTHAFARYVPQLIALSASSPFYQGIDTAYFSSRSTIFTAFPSCGVMPYLKTWEEFCEYFYKMYNLKIIHSMKDLYWDIRPKPEFGTIEIRVCDTPLTIKKAVAIAAYIQSLALYLLKEKPAIISKELYHLYNYNRFEASRYGLGGEFIDAETSKKYSLSEDILNTVSKIERYANQLNNMGYISLLVDDVVNKRTDAGLLRNIFKETGSLTNVVAEQCKLWLTE